MTRRSLFAMVAAAFTGRVAVRRYALARQWGWMSANDVRELEDQAVQ